MNVLMNEVLKLIKRNHTCTAMNKKTEYLIIKVNRKIIENVIN